MSHEDFLNLDIDITEWSVRFKFRETNYILSEASLGAVAKYRDAITSGITMDSNGTPINSTGFQMAEVNLLASSISKEDDNSKLPVEVVKTWPNRITDKLIESLKENSDMETGTDVDTLKKQRDVLDQRIKSIEQDEEGNGP